MEMFTLDGKRIDVLGLNRIVIYGSGKILYHIESKDFEIKTLGTADNGETKLKDGFYSKYDDISKIFLRNEPKRAIKENLNRTDNFYMKYKPDWSYSTGNALYIHESEIKVEFLGDILSFDTEDEKNYLRTFKLTFINPVEYRIKNAEKIYLEKGENWTLPDGCTWSSCYGTEEKPTFDTFDEFLAAELFPSKYPNPRNGVVKKWLSYETISNSKIIVTERYYSKTVLSDYRIENIKIAEMLNTILSDSKKLSHYDIDNIRKKYNLTLTEKEA